MFDNSEMEEDLKEKLFSIVVIKKKIEISIDVCLKCKHILVAIFCITFQFKSRCVLIYLRKSMNGLMRADAAGEWGFQILKFCPKNHDNRRCF